MWLCRYTCVMPELPGESFSWAKERVAALEALIWRAYCIEGDIRYKRPHPQPAKFPSKKADQDRLSADNARYYIEQTFLALRAEPDAASWSDRDRRDAIDIERRARDLGCGLYYQNCSAKPEELAALLPGLSLKLCDAWLAHLGATQH